MSDGELGYLAGIALQPGSHVLTAMRLLDLAARLFQDAGHSRDEVRGMLDTCKSMNDD